MRGAAYGATALSCFLGVPASAQQTTDVSYTTLGDVGLLDMPSAHMAPDGTMAFTVGQIGNDKRYNFTFQRQPYLSGTFSYTRWAPGVYDRRAGLKLRLFQEDSYIPDVSVGLCNLLGTGIYDCQYLVASKHVQNFDLTAGLGWGRMASNATFTNPFAAVFPSFKSPQQVVPTAFYSGLANVTHFFHGPDVGVFGGITWQTPIPGLDLMAEYSSDQYAYEVDQPHPVFHYRSPVNLGLSYHPFDFLSLSAGWYYGDTYGFSVSVSGDAAKSFSRSDRIGPDVPAPVIRSDSEQAAAVKTLYSSNTALALTREGGAWVHVPTEAEEAQTDLRQAFYAESIGVRDIEIQGSTLIVDAHLSGDASQQCAHYAKIAAVAGSRIRNVAMSDLYSDTATVTFCPVGPQAKPVADRAVADRDGKQPDLARNIARDMVKQDLLLDGFSSDQSELWLYYENGRYREESEAIGRIARVLMADAPPSVELFHIVSSPGGVPSQEATIIRSALERTIENDGVLTQSSGAITLKSPPVQNPALDAAVSSTYPRFSWWVDPRLSEHLFDPSSPLQLQVYAEGNANLQLAPGLVLATTLTANIWNNLTYNTPPTSVLPHVRTDLLQYLRDGQYGITFLGAYYRTKLAPDVFAEGKIGYLEDMFMGGGGDVLWRPDGSRLAFGADLYQVWQRDYNRLFGAQRYNVLTGHVSIYYASPWSNVNYALHVGRYLAGDYGATLEITRRFSTGIEIGAWATLTNVPFSKFGEGSFDKGIIIHIPFEWGLPTYSQASYDLRLASLTRDGGQRLADDDSLFEETRRTSDGEITQHLDDVVAP